MCRYSYCASVWTFQVSVPAPTEGVIILECVQVMEMTLAMEWAILPKASLSHKVSLIPSSLRFWMHLFKPWWDSGPIQPLFPSEINMLKSFGMLSLKNDKEILQNFKFLKQIEEEPGRFSFPKSDNEQDSWGLTTCTPHQQEIWQGEQWESAAGVIDTFLALKGGIQRINSDVWNLHGPTHLLHF